MLIMYTDKQCFSMGYCIQISCLWNPTRLRSDFCYY